MLINFGAVLMYLNGTVINKQDGTTMTLGIACSEALTTVFEDEKDSLSGEEKAQRYKLAFEIHNAGGPLDISPYDVFLIKKAVGKGYTTIIAGQVWRLLDG